MIVSVATGIHKIKHGGKPIPTLHPPFQWSPYMPFVYNKTESLRTVITTTINLIPHTQKSYLTRIECFRFQFFPGLVHPSLIESLRSTDETSLTFCLCQHKFNFDVVQLPSLHKCKIPTASPTHSTLHFISAACWDMEYISILTACS